MESFDADSFWQKYIMIIMLHLNIGVYVFLRPKIEHRFGIIWYLNSFSTKKCYIIFGAWIEELEGERETKSNKRKKNRHHRAEYSALAAIVSRLTASYTLYTHFIINAVTVIPIPSPLDSFTFCNYIFRCAFNLQLWKIISIHPQNNRNNDNY